MTGSVSEKSPVISTTLASEVSGARAAAANTAPIAITAYSAGGRPGPEQMVRDVAVGVTGGDADEPRRREDPARAADPHRQAGREYLAEGEHDQEPQRVLTGRGLEHDRVAHPVHLR